MGASSVQIWDHLKVKAKVKLQLETRYLSEEETIKYFQTVRKSISDAKYADADFKKANPYAKLDYVTTGDNCSDLEKGILVLQLLHVNLPTILDLGEDVAETGYVAPEVDHPPTRPPASESATLKNALNTIKELDL